MLSVFLFPFAAILYALAFVLSRLARLVDRPFAAVRLLSSATGRAASHERQGAEARDRYHRVAPHDWPRMPGNALAETEIERYLRGPRREADVIIVPGFTADDETNALSVVGETRLRTAIRDHRAGRAPFILVSGGNVHPVGTHFNEAFEMRAYLLSQGIPPSAILLEPFAMHSHTNLRNAGRLMRQLGLETALVVSSGTPLIGQSRTFALPSSFGGGVDIRSHLDSGVSFGTYEALDTTHTRFAPSADVDLADPTSTDP